VVRLALLLAILLADVLTEQQLFLIGMRSASRSVETSRCSVGCAAPTSDRRATA
jgi:hypothetical protein